MSSAFPEQPAAPEPEPRRRFWNRRSLIIATACLTATAVVVGGLLLLNYNDEAADEERAEEWLRQVTDSAFPPLGIRGISQSEWAEYRLPAQDSDDYDYELAGDLPKADSWDHCRWRVAADILLLALEVSIPLGDADFLASEDYTPPQLREVLDRQADERALVADERARLGIVGDYGCADILDEID